MLIVVRDFAEKGNNKEVNVTKLEQWIEKIWKNCKMPEKTKDEEHLKISDMFKIEVIVLPHKDLEE